MVSLEVVKLTVKPISSALTSALAVFSGNYYFQFPGRALDYDAEAC